MTIAERTSLFHFSLTSKVILLAAVPAIFLSAVCLFAIEQGSSLLLQTVSQQQRIGEQNMAVSISGQSIKELILRLNINLRNLAAEHEENVMESKFLLEKTLDKRQVVHDTMTDLIKQMVAFQDAINAGGLNQAKGDKAVEFRDELLFLSRSSIALERLFLLYETSNTRTFRLMEDKLFQKAKINFRFEEKAKLTASSELVERMFQVSDAMLNNLAPIQADAKAKAGEAFLALSSNNKFNAYALTLSIAVLVLAVAFLFATRGLVRPISDIVRQMLDLSQGNANIEIGYQTRADEIGKMARALNVFRDNEIEKKALAERQRLAEEQAEAQKREMMQKLASEFETSVGTIIETVSISVSELNETADAMAGMSEQTTAKAAAVATASDQASSNVQAMAAAVEEMAASIDDITNQTANASQVSKKAVQAVGDTAVQMEALTSTANKISEVINVISVIAQQTNILALNATIEAARAGEAGKGFAVVASEVKDLADQTASATKEINNHIDQIQAASDRTVGSVGVIEEVIGLLNDTSTGIAAAMEEQGATIREFSRNIHNAASGSHEVNTNIADVSSAVQETGVSFGQVAVAASKLSKQSNQLKQQVDTFISQIRAG